MKLRGRIWLGLWLLFFFAVSVAVVARQRASLTVADELNRLRVERLNLEAARAEHERRIQEGSSRRVLVPRAERLGLHVPTDAEYLLFGMTTRPDSGD